MNDGSAFDARYPVPVQYEAATPAYAVMEANGTATVDGVVVTKVRQYQASEPPKVLLVNHPCNGDASGYGKASLGFTPVKISIASVNAGAYCGPTHNSWALTADYPGFIAITASSSNTAWVVRNPGPTICRATTVNAVASNANSWSCDGVVAISGLCPVQGSGNTITVTPMSAGWETDADAIGLVQYDEAAKLWRPIDFPCAT